MNRATLFLITIIVVAAATYAAVTWLMPKGTVLGPTPLPPEVITTFEECAARYPVMESYPEQCTTPDGKRFVREIGNELTLNDRIVNSIPRPGDLVKSPLTIQGEARGVWYFEASFPVRLEGASGTVLAQGPAQALGEWMTTEFVPYSATLTFVAPTSTATGTLILTRDDPSGMRTPEELRIPIRFR